MQVLITKSACGASWHVNENERLNVDDRFGATLIDMGVAVLDPDIPETATVKHSRNAMRPAPQSKTKG